MESFPSALQHRALLETKMHNVVVVVVVVVFSH